jgi:hypothetical protein
MNFSRGLNISLRVKADLINLKILHELFPLVLDHEKIGEVSIMNLETCFGYAKIAVKYVLSNSDTDLRITKYQIVLIIHDAVFIFKEKRL